MGAATSATAPGYEGLRCTQPFLAFFAAAFFSAFFKTFFAVFFVIAMSGFLHVGELRWSRGQRVPIGHFFLAAAFSASASFQPASQASSNASLASAISLGTRRGFPARQASRPSW